MPSFETVGETNRANSTRAVFLTGIPHRNATERSHQSSTWGLRSLLCAAGLDVAVQHEQKHGPVKRGKDHGEELFQDWILDIAR
jgi:hypothetical protein